LEKEGYHPRVIHVTSNGRELYKVRIGPHGSREEAMKAMKDIRTALKVDVILIIE
jgi:cell division protein FtsN